VAEARIAWRRLGLRGGGSDCVAEARIAWRRLGSRGGGSDGTSLCDDIELVDDLVDGVEAERGRIVDEGVE
jgi:hypothetical protein